MLEFWSVYSHDILEIVGLSLGVSGGATLVGSLLGIPLGSFLAMRDFRGKRQVVHLTYSLMALPPVLAGLVVYLLLSKNGPLGRLELLFTPWAMILAQVMLVIPIVTGLTFAAVAAQDKAVQEQARSLGATPGQAFLTVLREARGGIMSGILTGFGRAFAEVGAVMLVGGNIRHETRVLTTAILMETRQGNFDMAVVLGLILLLLSFIVSSMALMGNQEALRKVA